ncbi:MAG: zinc-dependent metalloprotease [Actinomycetota bacterium]
MARLIDPTIARLVARRLAGDAGEGSYLLDRLHSDLEEAVPVAERLVAEASGIPAPPPVRWGVIDRGAWADANIAGMTRLLSPLTEKVGKRLDSLPMAVRLGQTAAVSVEVGVLLGYISRRVLGQYDLLVPEAEGEQPRIRRWGRRALPSGDGSGVLYFVGPNIVDTERRFGFVPREFALWVALHEVTHRFQFDGVPWLRQRFLSLLESYLGLMDIDARSLAGRIGSAAARLLSGSVPPEERNPVYLLASDEQRARLDEIQGLMAVVEGHGNHVMDTVGASEIPSFERMRRVFEGRRAQTTRLQRAIHHAIGLEMKLRQYELGQAFCDEVVARGGRGSLSRLWEGPGNLPTMAELRRPELWLKRVA